METSRDEFKVGLFVSLGVLVLATMTFMLGGDKILFHKYYYLKASFYNVDGLVKGSIVSVSGVTVGNIEDIVFSTNNQKLDIILRIDEQFHKRITRTSVAKIKTQGALGDKFIFIAPGSPGQPALKNGESIATEEHGDFLGTLADHAEGVNSVFGIIKELEKLLQNVNGDERSLTLMKNLNTSAEHMSELLQSTQKVVAEFNGEISKNKSLSRSLGHMSNILEKIDKGRGTLGSLVNDPTVYHRLQELLGGSGKNSYLKAMIRKTIENGNMEREDLK